MAAAAGLSVAGELAVTVELDEAHPYRMRTVTVSGVTRATCDAKHAP
jgi:hypothetical protein